MVCLYILFIQWVIMAKGYYRLRFDPSLYGDFKAIVLAGGCTVTGAFERFMRGCVEVRALVFADQGAGVRLKHVFSRLAF